MMRRERDKTAFLSLWLLLLAMAFSCVGRHGGEDEVNSEWVDSLRYTYRYGIRTDSLDVTGYTVNSGDNPVGIFTRLGFSAAEADRISRIAAPVLNPTRLRAGTHYYTFTTQDSLAAIRYISFEKSFTDYAVIDFTGDTVAAYEYNKTITLKRVYTGGVIRSSLWNALQASGADPLLANRIADVFAWQIDFYDVKEGDSFEALYDVAYIDDTVAIHIAHIEGALFIHQGKEFAAIPFMQGDGIRDYFDKEGNSLRKTFLKAPLDLVRITSRFSNSRFHPILKRYRAHHGVDYAAPVGTPVKTIGSGVVTAKGYQSGGGNFIKVRHNAVYTTTYMHLSRFPKGIKTGSTVQQGEVIGYVGSTGLSTGPHLDFRVHKNGQPVNPLKIESPPSEPVKPALRDSFELIKQRVLAELDSFRCLTNRSAGSRLSPPGGCRR
ncbi:MAG: peptidoglycan DD-metalloendopeptidase family protein [Tannerellaceae bacterium]|jgi:murein DD-endopeptidase MepM/ murein hydrolase activator NlpD|nr:peptidoglycan DD-metalloendopeptidase family protein [Tannerellaceae bacterium]